MIRVPLNAGIFHIQDDQNVMERERTLKVVMKAGKTHLNDVERQPKQRSNFSATGNDVFQQAVKHLEIHLAIDDGAVELCVG